MLRHLRWHPLLATVILLIAAGRFLKWNVLVAVGIAPVILGEARLRRGRTRCLGYIRARTFPG